MCLVASPVDTPPAQAPPERPETTGNLLRIREFRLLCITQLATGLRMPMLFFTQAWYVSEAAPDERRVLLLGLLASVRGAVFLLYILFGGAFADRFPRRTMLLASHAFALGGVTVTGALLLLPGAGEGEGAWLWVMLILFSGFALINAQDLPTRSAMIHDMVPPARVTSAVTIFQLALAGTMLVGSPIAGWSIEHLGFGATYMLAGAPHLIVLLVVLRMRSGGTAADPASTEESVLANVRAGIDILRRDPVVRWIVLLTWIGFATGISVMGLLVAAWVRDVLELGATGWGVMAVFWGIGAVLASLVLMARGEYGLKGPLFLGATLMFGLAILGFSLSRNVASAFLFNALAGAAFQVIVIVGIASVQTAVPPRLLGRVMALLMLAQGIAQVGAFALGALSQLIGMEVLFPAAGVAIMLLTLATVGLQRPLRTFN